MQPPWAEMERIIADVSAGMAALCSQAREPVVCIGFDPHVEPPQFRPDFWILSGVIHGRTGLGVGERASGVREAARPAVAGPADASRGIRGPTGDPGKRRGHDAAGGADVSPR
jgi:hypothetical protein